MSTPMFVREPRITRVNSLGGHSLLDVAPETYASLLAEAVDEALLIEEVRWCVRPQTGGLSTDAGVLMLYVNDPDAVEGPDARTPIGTYALDAGTSTQMASGVIPLNMALGVGWKLYAAHNVQKSGASGYVTLGVVASGGVVR